LNEPPEHTRERVTTDLVEYVIIALPDLESLAAVAPALTELVQRSAIRILDLVVLVKDRDGVVTTFDLDDFGAISALRDVEGDLGGMLSDRDIGLASLALRPATTGVVLVIEDRWARPLSLAALRAGGQIITGERIPASRVETARADLLVRPPCVAAMYEAGWTSLLVDPTEQLQMLGDLLARGLLSPTEFEHEKAKVIEP
jgi:hypothetical protein